jgi:hypothetical protein
MNEEARRPACEGDRRVGKYGGLAAKSDTSAKCRLVHYGVRGLLRRFRA